MSGPKIKASIESENIYKLWLWMPEEQNRFI